MELKGLMCVKKLKVLILLLGKMYDDTVNSNPGLQ